MEILSDTFLDLPGVGGKEWDEAVVSISTTFAQIEELDKAHGIDALKMIESVIASESYMLLCKLISKTAFDKPSEEIKWQEKSIYWLMDLISHQKPKFIITNVKIGTGLENMDQFVMEPLSKTFNHAGGLYKIGEIKNVPVYVDPMLRWDDEKLVLVENDYLEYEIDKNSLKRVSDEMTLAPKFIMTIRYKLHNAKSKVYDIVNINL